MSYEYLSVGTIRITAQAYITPTSTPVRIYSIHAVSSANNATVVLANTASSTTATSIGTDTIAVPTTLSGTSYVVGDWENTYGVRFDSGVLVKTSTSFAWAEITYVLEK